MAKTHQYQVTIQWTGNSGEGTSTYRSYERSHTITGENKAEILASSDPVFRGDKTKYNPEDLLVASLSACHLLSYLHLCAVNGVVVVDYSDHASGKMEETPDGGGHFLEVTLNPTVTVLDQSMVTRANALHEKANELCFIAGSVNFPVYHKPTCLVKA
jgi:organic hydroperoxide reductase OsmC/OhrA